MQIDLKDGVLPISRAASSLAQQIKRVQTTGQPVVITQKGYPQAVLLSIDTYYALTGRAAQPTDDQTEQAEGDER